MLNSWMNVLQVEVAKANITTVAKQLGYSRTTVSLILAGRYNGSTNKFGKAVSDTFGVGIHCPHLETTVTKEQCVGFHTLPMPQSNAAALRHWRRCQGCEHSITLKVKERVAS